MPVLGLGSYAAGVRWRRYSQKEAEAKLHAAPGGRARKTLATCMRSKMAAGSDKAHQQLAVILTQSLVGSKFFENATRPQVRISLDGRAASSFHNIDQCA